MPNTASEASDAVAEMARIGPEATSMISGMTKAWSDTIRHTTLSNRAASRSAGSNAC